MVWPTVDGGAWFCIPGASLWNMLSALEAFVRVESIIMTPADKGLLLCCAEDCAKMGTSVSADPGLLLAPLGVVKRRHAAAILGAPGTIFVKGDKNSPSLVDVGLGIYKGGTLRFPAV